MSSAIVRVIQACTIADNILTAVVAQVLFGAIEIEGLKIEDGRYAVAVQQVAALFQLRQDKPRKSRRRPSTLC